MNDEKKLDDLAEIGRKLIDFQFMLASIESEDALKDSWALGYCFGLFDAIAQRAELDQYTEGLGLITIGFMSMCGVEQGSKKVAEALDKQADARFTEGNRTGGTDLFSWAPGTKTTPMSLFNHLVPAT